MKSFQDLFNQADYRVGLVFQPAPQQEDMTEYESVIANDSEHQKVEFEELDLEKLHSHKQYVLVNSKQSR